MATTETTNELIETVKRVRGLNDSLARSFVLGMFSVDIPEQSVRDMIALVERQ